MPDLTGQPNRRFVGFTGIIDDQAASRIAATLNIAVNEGVEELHFAMSSPGGAVYNGIYVYNHIRALPLKVIAYNTGSVASIATAIFVAADERHCSVHGVFMIHPTSFNPQAGMTATLLQTTLDGALADDARTDAILRERANIPNDILAARRTREVYITAADAVAHGLANSVREFELPPGHAIFQI